MKNIILNLTLALILGLTSLTSLAVAAEKAKVSKTKAVQATPQTTQPSAPAVNPITQAAVNAGVRTCTNRINQVANFLTTGSQDVRVIMFLPPDNPDQQLISASMEIPIKDTSSAYASASFAPNQASGCAGMYETVVYWPQKCTEVAEKNFGTFKKAGLLSKKISVLDDGVATKIFLMPAATGCVSIKKEIVR